MSQKTWRNILDSPIVKTTESRFLRTLRKFYRDGKAGGTDWKSVWTVRALNRTLIRGTISRSRGTPGIYLAVALYFPVTFIFNLHSFAGLTCCHPFSFHAKSSSRESSINLAKLPTATLSRSNSALVRGIWTFSVLWTEGDKLGENSRRLHVMHACYNMIDAMAIDE